MFTIERSFMKLSEPLSECLSALCLPSTVPAVQTSELTKLGALSLRCNILKTMRISKLLFNCNKDNKETFSGYHLLT